MFEHHEAPAVRRMIQRLRDPVAIDPRLDDRIMARIAADPHSWSGSVWAWLVHPQPIPVPPLAFLLAAAVIAGVVVSWHGSGAPARVESPVESNQAVNGASPVQFVVVAPGASSVALVGDFNDWDSARTPMRLASRREGAGSGGAGGLWTVVIPLTPGRHRYAFLVDGSRWVADPAAPRAQDDFGAPSSVVTVGG